MAESSGGVKMTPNRSDSEVSRFELPVHVGDTLRSQRGPAATGIKGGLSDREGWGRLTWVGGAPKPRGDGWMGGESRSRGD